NRMHPILQILLKPAIPALHPCQSVLLSVPPCGISGKVFDSCFAATTPGLHQPFPMLYSSLHMASVPEVPTRPIAKMDVEIAIRNYWIVFMSKQVDQQQDCFAENAFIFAANSRRIE